MKIIKYMVMAVMLLFTASAVSQDLQPLISECEACHGPGGISSDGDIPSLAGKKAEDLSAALEEFYYYERHCYTTSYRHGDLPKTPMNMCNVANTLSDEDKQAIAEYFSGQK